MREIKFRAWVTNRDGVTYSNGDHMEYDVTIVDGKYADVEGGWDIHGTYPYHLMQYTGLKDKNGKEIYEGDLIKVIHYDHVEGHGKVKTGESICEVAYENGMAGYMPFADGSCPIDIESDWGDWEIIGNIWENPELIDTPETIHVGDEDKIDLAVISTDDEDGEDGSIPM